MNSIVGYSILFLLIGIFIGMFMNSYLYRQYLHSKSDCSSPACFDDKFYYIVSEKKYVMMSIRK